MPRLLIFIVAYHAETTIEAVLRRIPTTLADNFEVEILIIDDGSADDTFMVGVNAGRAGRVPFRMTVLYNSTNQGYGGNQKIGYHYAIENGFDYVALLHGDGQYAPEVLPDLMKVFDDPSVDAVFGSRMLRRGDALKGKMPLYKYFGNRILTKVQNRLLGTGLSEFHSGYRVYTIAALRQIPFERNTNDFHFDTEIIIQLVLAGKKVAEHPIPTYYGDEICRVNGLKYARDVVKASLQARLQKVHLFYDRRFDCAPSDAAARYPSKLDFDSTHARVFELVLPGSRVLDLGSGTGAVGDALTERKGCRVVGVDIVRGAMTAAYEAFIIANLNEGIPRLDDRPFDYVLALDVIEHMNDPERFLDELRDATAPWPDVKIILTTGNVGFVIMRLSLLIGRFEYGRRGILDMTHTRLFTFATLRRALVSAGLVLEQTEGVVPPLPFIFGSSPIGRALMVMARLLVRLRPRLFAFQCLVVARPRPTLQTLLDRARSSAREKAAAA